MCLLSFHSAGSTLCPTTFVYFSAAFETFAMRLPSILLGLAPLALLTSASPLEKVAAREVETADFAAADSQAADSQAAAAGSSCRNPAVRKEWYVLAPCMRNQLAN